MWDVQFRRYAAAYHVVRYDLRGHGRSPYGAAAHSHVEDLQSLLAEIVTEPVSVIGLCVGGRVAAEFTLAHPNRVHRLVVAASPLGRRGWSDELGGYEAAAEEAAAASMGDIDRLLEINLRLWVAGLRRAPALEPAVRARVVATMRRSLEARVAAGVVALPRWPDPPAVERLDEIRLPVLALVGDEDVPEIRETAADVAALAPCGRVEVIAGGGHLLSLEKPGEFDAAVLRFLGE